MLRTLLHTLTSLAKLSVCTISLPPELKPCLKGSTRKELFLCHTTHLDLHYGCIHISPSLFSVYLPFGLSLSARLPKLSSRCSHLSRAAQGLRSLHVWPCLCSLHGDRCGTSPYAHHPAQRGTVSDVRTLDGSLWRHPPSRHRNRTHDQFLCVHCNSPHGESKE